MKLSENFSLYEFTKLHSTQITPIQMFMLKALCEDILQPLRNFLSCKIKVVSGIRTIQDIARLKRQGYYPSETSDHFFGTSITLNSHKKIQRFGIEYSYSVGAADIIPACGSSEAFKKLREYFEPQSSVLCLPAQNIRIGQFILEHGKNISWFHVSNPATLVYSKDFVNKYLKKIPFLLSLDNGKSYQSVT